MLFNCRRSLKTFDPTFAAISSSQHDIKTATFYYTADTGKRQAVSKCTEVENKAEIVATEQFIRNARSVFPSPKISDFGFELIKHDTGFAKEKFLANWEIQPAYYREIEEAVKKVFPDAGHVKAFHHVVR